MLSSACYEGMSVGGLSPSAPALIPTITAVMNAVRDAVGVRITTTALKTREQMLGGRWW